MKGLLIKDFNYITNTKNKQIVALVVGMICVIVFGSSDGMGMGCVGYSTMLGLILTINTMSMDNYEKCTAYILTMPITRKTYVLEKYVFYTIISLIGLVLPTVYFLIVQDVNVSEMVISAVIILFVIMSMGLVTIPILYKFGIEKAHIVIMIFVMAVIILVMGWEKIIEVTGMAEMPQFLSKAMQALEDMNAMVLSAGILLVLALFWALSYVISCHIINNKEF